jgi:hypothetical protein
MFSQISYNVVIDRFKAFADGHYLIRRFSHGQIDKTDLEKDQEFPWMHVVPTSVVPSSGQRAYSFDIVFTDLPREKEVNAEYQRESLSDCIRLAEDLLAEIRNGLTLFGTEVELADTVTMQPFIEEYTHVLTGVTLSCTLVVPWNWSACDIPANYAPGGSGSGGSGGGGNNLVLKVNGVNNVVQNILDLVEGTGINITDNGDGSVTFTNTGGGGGSVAWGSIVGTLASQVDLTTALNLKADISSLGAVAFSNDYNDLDNLPTIPDLLGDLSDVDTTGEVFKNVLYYNGTQWVPYMLAAVAYSGSYLDLSNTPVIPKTLKDLIGSGTSVGDIIQWNGSTWVVVAPSWTLSGLTDVNIPSPTNGQVLVYDSATSKWIAGSNSASPTGAAGGDLNGTYPNPTVDGIHGIEMQSGTPTAGDTWVYGGSPAKWQHQMLHASQVDNDSAVTGTHVDDALNHLSTTKVESNAAITGATATKVTYDSKGLVTSGTTLAASDIPSGVDATKIGSGNVSNTEFGYLDGVTSAIQTQIGAKQDTLISGTNIKTVNSTSLLGSGDVAVQATLVSGTNIKTINSASVLGSGNLSVAAQDSISLINNTNVTVGTSATSYVSFCAFTTNSTEASRQVIIPVAGTIKNLYVLTSTTQSAGGSQVCTVRKNTANTAITTTIAANAVAGTFSDTTNSVSVAAGDKLSLQVQNNAATGAAATIVSVAIIIERS